MTTNWNPSDLQQLTLSGSNLIATATGAHGAVRSVDRVTSGKYYWEITCTTFTNNGSAVGVALYNTPFNNITVNVQSCCVVFKTGAIWLDTVNLALSIGAISSGAIVCLALDMDNGFFWVRNGIAGNWNGSAANSPTSPFTGINVKAWAAFPTLYALGAPTFSTTGDSITANFGATAFSGTVPTGYTSGFPSGTVASTALPVAGVNREVLGGNVGVAWMGGVAREALVNPATAIIAAGVAMETLRTPDYVAPGGQVAVTINVSM